MKPVKAVSRGRKPFLMSDEHRVKIQNSNILNRLIECGEGRVEMTATQATVALGLLRKVLPDMSAVTLGGEPEGGNAISFTVVYEAKKGIDYHSN